MNSISPSTPTAIRLALYDKGWHPIPVTAPKSGDKEAGKKPLLPAWRTISITAPVIQSWAKGRWRYDTNTGIRTRGLVAVDIDVLDTAIADQILAIAAEMLGETPLVRIGKAPKKLACYKAAADVAKAKTPDFFYKNGDKSAVECLSDGQQFIAFGIHPGTGKPYQWVGQSPLDVAVDDLPVVDARRMKDFLARAETVLREAGGQTAKELKGVAERPTRQRAPRQHSGHYPPPSRQDVESALESVSNTHDWHGWFKIGAAIFDALGPEGEDLFLKWSAQSSKDVPLDTIDKYRSFSRSAPTVTAASLFYEARQNGWLSERELERARTIESASSFDEPTDLEPIDDCYYAAQEAVDFAPVSSDEVDAVIAEFNVKYMVVNEDGKAKLYAPAHDPILNRRFHHRMDFADLQKLYLNRTVRVGVDKDGEPVFNQVAGVWLRHRDRRQYIDGVVFDPSGNHDNPDILNLWQGFAVKSKSGSWERMKRHIYEVICCSTQALFDYTLNWMARLVQFPAQQGEVAIVLKGIEGTGKGTLARALLHILGQHGLTISHAKHLVGNFNAHLRDAVFLFADEAFYAGDKSHVGVLKALITEPTLTVEAKYQNAVQAPNFVHLMMASNEDWVVPASLDARRFLVLEVAATKVRDRAYFTAIWQEMENGGYEAMLHDLLNKDLEGFDVRDVPETEGLQRQKKLSLGTSEAWWMDVLHRGYVWRSKLGLEAYFSEWHETVTTEVLFASYTEFAKAKNERHPMAREAFGRFLVKMGGTASRPRNAVVGEHIADVPINQYGETTRKAALVKQDRSHGYSFGDLKAARQAFADATKLDGEWEWDGEEPS